MKGQMIKAEAFLTVFPQFCGTRKKESLLRENCKYFKLFATIARMTHKDFQLSFAHNLTEGAGRLPCHVDPLFWRSKLLGLR
jgi:hypothetical protein